MRSEAIFITIVRLIRVKLTIISLLIIKNPAVRFPRKILVITVLNR